MKQADLNLIVAYAGQVKDLVLSAKSRAQPDTGTAAARQRECISAATRVAETMLERLRAL